MRLDVAPQLARAVRQRAREEGVSVDAWLGIALAVSDAQLDPRSSRRMLDFLAERPAELADQPRLAAWQRYLAEADGPSVRDELPEIVLSDDRPITKYAIERAAELPRSLWIVGRECEIRAVGIGDDLSSYLRRVALP